MAKEAQRRIEIEFARGLVPDWGIEHFDAAMAGDVRAASGLITALHPEARAEMVYRMWRAKIPPSAFRVALENTLSQTHYYQSVLSLARGRRGLERWLKYAEFGAPPGDSDTVTIWRGGSGAKPYELMLGLSWTVRFDVAAWFACRSPEAGPPVVLELELPRNMAFWIGDSRSEAEVIPAQGLHFRSVRIVDDQARIRVGAERREASEQAVG